MQNHIGIKGEFIKICAIVVSTFLLSMQALVSVSAEPMQTQTGVLGIASPSVILMEASTGQILFEQNATEHRSPASITKIMTLLLTFEAIEDGRVHLDDRVITSEYASSMGGSQVFLAQGEEQTLDTMIKCIVVASGNDASVAVAEHVAGSEQAFVKRMNEKAISLGMLDTHFEDCCGLSDSDDHYSSAKDVAIMSKELITKYPQIFDYTKIWMEDITHTTAQGSAPFTLSSTNKLLKQYPYATGLKTGSTSKAKFCLSATAKKDGIDLIAVVMGAPDKNSRLSDAQTLLTYGFGICKLYSVEHNVQPQAMDIRNGVQKTVPLEYDSDFRYVDISGEPMGEIEEKLVLPEKCSAPVTKGQKAGTAEYYLNGVLVGEVPVLYAETVEKAGFGYYLGEALKYLLL